MIIGSVLLMVQIPSVLDGGDELVATASKDRTVRLMLMRSWNNQRAFEPIKFYSIRALEH
nr:hypothetical protein Iba_chr11fCG0550 [Ipomoea batatas]